MNQQVNLMTSRAYVTECVRSRTRQWMRILAVVSLLLACHFVLSWIPAYQDRQQCIRMEACYEPVRQMKAHNQTLAKRIDNLQDQGQFELALSQQTPVLSLFGLVSQSVAETRGAVFLEDLSFLQQPISVEETDQQVTEIVFSGIGANVNAVNRFADTMKSTLPFAKVELATIETIEVNRHPMQSFQVKCTF